MISSRKSLSLALLLLAQSSFVHAFSPQNLLSTTSRGQQLQPTTSLWSSVTPTSAELDHAKEVFSLVDADGSGCIDSSELAEMLNSLDIEASQEEADALFRFLDADGSDSISLDEFLPWYNEAVEAAKEVSSSFQALLMGRRTVESFDQTPVSDDVLRRAIACAIAAPNRSGSEPWRFIQVGPETVGKIESLKASMETEKGQGFSDWTEIPGWCVVTSKLSSDPETELEDFKSTSCAVQNFMLSCWSDGIGTKWTSGPVQKTEGFAELCGVDTSKERVVGCIWYGFATGGLVNADPKRRKKTVDDVLTSVP